LEIGFGLGNNLSGIAMIDSSAHLYGTEISDVAIEYTRERLRNYEFQILDPYDFLSERRFDLILDRCSIQHMPRILARHIVHQSLRSLKPDGVMYSMISTDEHGAKIVKPRTNEPVRSDAEQFHREYYSKADLISLYSGFEFPRLDKRSRQVECWKELGARNESFDTSHWEILVTPSPEFR